MTKFLYRRLLDALIISILVSGYWLLCDKIFAIDWKHLSDGPHYVLQAQAWLQGHFDIQKTDKIGDYIVHYNKIFIIYPPLPALLMLPFVWLLGDNFSDIWFTWIISATMIVMFFRLLEVLRVRLITTKSTAENLLIAGTLGFGSIVFYLSLGGKVWFTGEIVELLVIVFMLHATFSQRWILTSVGAGMILLTRTSDIFTILLPITVWLVHLGVGQKDPGGRRRFLPQRLPSLSHLAGIIIPFACAVVILLLRNRVYFGGFTSTGYDLQNMQNYPQIKNGVLSPVYIWPNVVIDFLRFPSFGFTSAFDIHPTFDPVVGGYGTSVFFSTPVFLFLLFGTQGKTRFLWLRNALWATIGILLISVLLFCAAGWYQVGARYLLSLYPFLFIQCAMREERINIRWIAFAGLGGYVNSLFALFFWGVRHAKIDAYYLPLAWLWFGITILVILVRYFLPDNAVSEPDVASSINKSEVSKREDTVGLTPSGFIPFDGV